MNKIVLADCAQHHIAVPHPTMPEDYACPHCKVKALQARLDAVKKCNKPGYADLCVKAVALIELFHAVRKQEQGS